MNRSRRKIVFSPPTNLPKQQPFLFLLLRKNKFLRLHCNVLFNTSWIFLASGAEMTNNNNYHPLLFYAALLLHIIAHPPLHKMSDTILLLAKKKKGDKDLMFSIAHRKQEGVQREAFYCPRRTQYVFH
jgi:hypothetical protein